MIEFKINKVYKEIIDYIFLIFKVKKLSKTRDWAKNKLEYGWFFQIGTVVNMNKEDFGEQEEVIMTRFMSRAEHIFQYISNNNLGDILLPKIKRYGENYAFTLTFWTKFNYLTIWYVVSRTILIYIIYNIIDFLNKQFGILNFLVNIF
jgi:hypothetical protein